MAQAADTGGAGGVPFIKFAKLGDTFIGSFGGGKARQQIDFDKKEPKWKDAEGTKPLLEEVMWFSVMPGTTAYIGNIDDPQIPAVGDIVRYAVGGFRWGQTIDQRRNLPAYAGFAAGTPCSGDVYTITLAGWSTATDSPENARKAGFTVVEGRIVITNQADKDKYVLARSAKNQPVILANDFTITVRRPTPDEKAFEQAGDALFSSAPWDKQPAMASAGASPSGGYNPDEDEPF